MNEAFHQYRGNRRKAFFYTDADLDSFASPGDSTLQSVARAEVTHAIHDALAALPEKYRQVLILRDIEQFSGPETAQRLQSSIPLVKTRLFRARLMLSAELQRPARRKEDAPRRRNTAFIGERSPVDIAAYVGRVIA